jgi:Phage tail protein (Tail_P2_I)
MTDRLYGLLPRVHRARDAEADFPLRTILRALEDELDARDEDIARLYDDWFIETCDEAFLPYFAELVGLTLDPPGVDGARRRRQLANAIAHRRRKGTVAVLEQLALDATGWPAHALEFGARVAATASARFPGLGRRSLVDVSDGDALERLFTPFSGAAPVADVRRLSSHRRQGAGNLGAVGVVVWRLAADGVEHAPAANLQDSNHYTFDPLGRDTQLCIAPSPRTPGAAPASDLDVPAPISRIALERRLEDYYGPARSLCVYRDGRPVPRSAILVADLSGWRYRTPPDRVSVDPALGRIAFPERHAPEAGVWASASVLSVGAIGGGHYERLPGDAAADYRVGQRGEGVHRTVTGALRAWAHDGRPSAVIEIGDDGVYAERLNIRLAAGQRLELRAATGCRPILLPTDRRSNEPDMLRLAGPELEGAETAPPPDVVLDGIWVAGHPVELAGALGRVSLRHCTLVPASGALQLEGPHGSRDPSLVITAMPCSVSVDSSVLGRIRAESPEVGFDPVPLAVRDSVLDASDLRGRAIEGTGGDPAWVALTLERTTVLGGAEVTQVGLVEDSILMGPLRSERRQPGAVRFSYLAPGSRTPHRTACQPAAPEHDERVKPRFDALHFGAPAYARLVSDGPKEIERGAHDKGELGAYHDVWGGLRAADLRARLREFAPAGTDVDIIFAT